MKVEFLVWNFSAVVKYPFKTASKSIVSVLLTLNLYLTTSIVFPFSFLSTKIYLELARGCQENLIDRAYSRHSFHVLVVWCLVCCCPIILIFSLLPPTPPPPHLALTYLFQTHLYNLTVFWCFQGEEKGCISNKWVKFGLEVKVLTHW